MSKITPGFFKNPSCFWNVPRKYLSLSLHTLDKKSTSWHYHKSIIQWLFPAMLIHFIPILCSFQVFPLTDWKIIKDVFQLFDHLKSRQKKVFNSYMEHKQTEKNFFYFTLESGAVLTAFTLDTSWYSFIMDERWVAM